jgi:cell division protein FtsI/penicillin-binding protein 2
MTEMSKRVWLAVALVAIIFLGFTVWHRTRERPPESTVYFPAAYDEKGQMLFTVKEAANGFKVRSGMLRCRRPGTTAENEVSVAAEDPVICGHNVLELRAGDDELQLVATGLSDLEVPFTVGSGRPIDSDAFSSSHFVFPGPGVAVRHMIALPASACGGSTRTDELCIENGGATGSMLLFTPAATFRPAGGERRLVPGGTEVWLSYVPFLLEQNGALWNLNLLGDGSRWRRERGDREWQRLTLPTWTFARVDSGAYRVVSESTHYAPGHLTNDRFEPEQEQELQSLVDAELLCLDLLNEGGTLTPRLSWRTLERPGCSDPFAAAPASRPPVRDDAARAYRTAQNDARFGEMLAAANESLRRRDWDLDPSSSLFVMDYRFVGESGGTQRRLPVALLGVRPGVTLHAASKPAPAAEPLDIVLAANSVSPALELMEIGGSAPQQPLLLQLAAPLPQNPQQRPTMVVCTNINLGSPLAHVPAALPLGAISFAGNGVQWAPQTAGTPSGCVELTRHDRSVVARAAGGVTATHTSADSGTPAVLSGTPVRLEQDDLLTVGTRTFRFTVADDRAATTPKRQPRVYPLGADALPVIGLGFVTGGVEGAMSQQTRRRLRKVAEQAAVAGRRPAPIRLTIDGDMQRIVARELARVFSANACDPAPCDPDRRAAAVVLDSETGAVLAAATAPRFDPWHTPADTDLFRAALDGDPRRKKELAVRIENFAFLRRNAVGSTQKIATSLALLREQVPLSSSGALTPDSCERQFDVHAEGRGLIGHFPCLGTHAVVAGGRPAPEAWLHAFYKSCNVYFGAAALELVPGIDAGAFSQSGGPHVTLPARFDPSEILQPRDLVPSRPGQGNGFYETLLLLGYRFRFDGSGAPDQTAESYRSLRYPTADDAWLEGLQPGAGFIYPTVPAPELFAHKFLRNGGLDAVEHDDVIVDGKPWHVVARESMTNYLKTGWGQIMEGSPLSLAAIAVPVVNSSGAIITPQLFAEVIDARRARQRVQLLDAAQQQVMRTGFINVVANQAGTAHSFFRDVLPVVAAAGYEVGGKTGTIEISGARPLLNSRDAVDAVAWHGCGVLGTPASDDAWRAFLLWADQVDPAVGVRLRSYNPRLPQRGFAAETEACRALNPGMPRMAPKLDAAVTAAWDRAVTARSENSENEQVSSSSAFVAGMWPRNAPATRRLTIAVTFEFHTKGAKKAAAAIVTELARLLQVRGN